MIVASHVGVQHVHLVGVAHFTSLLGSVRPRTSVNVGAAALIYRLRLVALRCLGVICACSGNMVASSFVLYRFSARASMLCCVLYRFLTSFPIFLRPICLFYINEKSNICLV
jgi:hypothetical protein